MFTKSGRFLPLGDRGAVILDLACGKGGDLRKWGLAKPAHVVCVDIADVSIDQCRTRYEARILVPDWLITSHMT